MNWYARTALMIAMAGVLPAQTFEAASVKAVPVPVGLTLMEDGRVGATRGADVAIPRESGGPGTEDPGRIHYPLITLKQLLMRAWDSYYAIEGPGWLDSQTVAVDATMPPNTTRAQFQQMLRNLIAERFGLKFHVGEKEITGYALVVAKGGPKLKESADQGEADWARPPRPTSSKDGFPVLPPFTGKTLMTSQSADRSRILAQQITLDALAKSLASQLKTTVTDETGLTKKYDFTLLYASPEPLPKPPNMPAFDPLPDLFSAVQSQLGLKLDRKPIPVQVLVIDHMEKTPAGN